MKVVIAGGTGFLGSALTARLAADGHDITVLSRSARSKASTPQQSPQGFREPITIAWTPDGTAGPWAAAIDGADAVVNLAGASIADSRWTPAHKRQVLDSRVLATRSIVTAIRNARTAPKTLLNGSAVGYYGPRGDEVVTEDDRAGSDFLADVCVQWEAEASRAAIGRTRVVFLRTGLPLARDGGALPPLLRPFKLGVGGPMGSGRQYWPWIHRDDWVALVRWALLTPTADGPINVTAPAPVTNATFARALGRALHRPAFMPAPAFALRLLLGEMADALVLSGQRAVPAKAERFGFAFRYRTLQEALAEILLR